MPDAVVKVPSGRSVTRPMALLLIVWPPQLSQGNVSVSGS